MELFQDLPQVIQSDVLCQWLKQDDVARLDSAVCSKIIRPLFLHVLGNMCIYPSLDTTYEEQTAWAVLRSIRVKELTLRHTIHASVREKLFKSSAQSLRELNLCMEDPFEDGHEEHIEIDDTFFDIAMLCPMVQELSVWNAKATSNLNLVILKCTHLKTLRLAACTNITSSTIKSICSAPSLTCLFFTDSQFDSEAPDFSTYKSNTILELYTGDTKLSRAGKISLYSCFPCVTKVSLGFIFADDAITIASRCPHVIDTKIFLLDTMTDENVALLCQHWARIELLQLQSTTSNVVACSEQGVLTLLKRCPQLSKLCVCTLNYPYSDNYLYSNDPTAATDTHNITSIPTSTSTTTLTDSSTKPYKSSVTDLFLESASEATLKSILTLCPQLNTLSIRHTTHVKPPRTVMTEQQRAAEYALSCLNHPTCSVRKLHLHNIRSLAGVDLLSLTCLEELQLSNIGNKLTNEMLLKVVKNNPDLCSISLYNCELLRGYSLILSLLTACPALHTLNFTECDNIRAAVKSRSFSTTTLVLENVIKHSFPNIKKINIQL